MRAIAAALTALALAACGTAATPPAPAAAALASVNGSGCPTGTAVVTTSGDTTTITYSTFNAQAGTGIPATAGRRNCQLSFTLNRAGQRPTVTAVHHGTTALPAGTTGLVQAAYYVQGTVGPPAIVHPFTIPSSGDYSFTDNAPIAPACGETRNLNINVEARAGSPSGTAAIVAVQDTAVTLAWVAC